MNSISLPRLRITIALLLLVNCLIGIAILTTRSGEREAGITFLDVGQGDSALVRFKDGHTALIDAGPQGAMRHALDHIVPDVRALDVVIISHPQLDHFGGLRDALEQFSIGVVIVNGRFPDTPEGLSAWYDLHSTLAARKIPVLIAHAGSRVRAGDEEVDLLGPTATLWRSDDLNDSSIVARVTLANLKALFTGDIGFEAEAALIARYGQDLRQDVLKVAHHGSKYSTGNDFLSISRPRIAVISAGARNRYGHPSPETLSRLDRTTTALIFRTDERGAINVSAIDPQTPLRVRTEK